MWVITTGLNYVFSLLICLSSLKILYKALHSLVVVGVGVSQENPCLCTVLTIRFLARGWCKREASLQESFSFYHNFYSAICTCKIKKEVQ